MTFDEFIKTYSGKKTDYDGAYGVQCFTAGHYVLMVDNTYKAIEDVSVGDKVIGYDNEINTVVQKHTRKANVIKVRTDLSDIMVTADHPFYYLDGTFDSILKSEEKAIGIYDKAVYKESGLTDNELLFLGFWLGDGSLARHNDNRKPEIRITYSDSKKEFVNALKMASNIQPHTSGNGAVNATIKKRDHPLLAEIIFKCYNSKKEKVLPLIFNNRELALIVDGFIKADGCKRNNSYAVSNTSKSLLLSIQAACILCGYSTKSIRPFKRSTAPIIIKGKEVKSIKPIYRMTICKLNRQSCKKLQKVEYIGERTVYNIGTDGTHTYICDNYKVHNCVDLIKLYLDKCFGVKPGTWGNAHAYYDNFAKIPGLYKNFNRIKNTATFVPQKGDIMVWAKTKSMPYGHIAICDGKGDTTYFYSYDQNWTGRGDPCTRIKHNYNGVAGVLRPKKSATKSVTEVAKEVIAGKWGNGENRKIRLTQAGYNYSEVQKAVNKLL